MEQATTDFVAKFRGGFTRRIRSLARRIAKNPFRVVAGDDTITEQLREFAEALDGIPAEAVEMRKNLIIFSMERLCVLLPDTMAGLGVALSFAGMLLFYFEEQVRIKESGPAERTRKRLALRARRIIRKRANSPQLALFPEPPIEIPDPPTKTVLRRAILAGWIRGRGSFIVRVVSLWKGGLVSRNFYVAMAELVPLLQGKVSRVLVPVLGEAGSSGELARRPSVRVDRISSEEVAA